MKTLTINQQNDINLNPKFNNINSNKIQKEYQKYLQLIREYYELKIDEENLQKQFDKIVLHYKKLVNSGILVIKE